MEKVILEARINEYNMRHGNPHVPWTIKEIVEEACKVREAGASILHFHARTPEGGAANDPQIYREIIRRRKRISCSFPPWALTAMTRTGIGSES